jgi:hypothetical protein
LPGIAEKLAPGAKLKLFLKNGIHHPAIRARSDVHCR